MFEILATFGLFCILLLVISIFMGIFKNKQDRVLAFFFFTNLLLLSCLIVKMFIFN